MLRRLIATGLIACSLSTISLLPRLDARALAQAGPQAPAAQSAAKAPDAPEFPGGLEWLNTDRPLSLRELRGKVVLLDFWTYCCINCMHIIPELKKLEAKYPNELAVVGVHSAKFNNERDTSNIREAILRYDIEHPVINDNQLTVWRLFGVQAWPTLILIAPDGKVLGQVAGEPNFAAVDAAIAQVIHTYEATGAINRKPFHYALEKDGRPKSVLSYPGKIVADEATKRLFFTDSNHNRVVITTLDGAIQDVIGDGGVGLKDGDFASAQFFRPQGLCYDAARDALYVADTENHAVRQVDLKTRKVTTLAGNGQQLREFPPAGGQGASVSLSSPWDVSQVGNTLYIAMAGTHQLWTLDLKSGRAEPYAGSARENILDGPLAEANLAQPSGIATDGAHLYFADSEASAVREVDLGANAVVHTLIGEGLFEFGDKDGVYPAARFQHPLGVTYHNGLVYVADTYNHKIKRLNPRTREATTVIGSGKRGMADGPGRLADLNEPNGLTFAAGNLYITDTNNHVIRVFHPATGKLTTLKLTGIEKLTHALGTSAFKAPEQRLDPVDVSSAARSIVVTLKLPPGTKINEEAPFQVTATSDKPDVVGVAAPSAEKAMATVSIPITPKAGEASITVDLNVNYCREGHEGLCFFKEARLVIPIKVTQTGKVNPTISYAL